MKFNLGWLGLAPKSWNKKASNFMTGTPSKMENVSTLRPEQEPGFQDLTNAAQGNYGSGAFGKAGNYFSNLMSDNSEDYKNFSAPMLRQYNEEIVPGLSEQFAGMGAGGLSSSGFRNAQIQGATDLSERLGALRAQLRQAGAQGLMNIGQLGLQNYSQPMITEPGTQGFLSSVAPAIGQGIAHVFGSQASNWMPNNFGKTGAYGQYGPQASPRGY